MEKTIEIPEGYEARIEGNKVIIELKESEDERIRKALIDGVRQIRCKNGITQEQMIAYLEKQKEPSELEQLAKLREMTHEIREAYERGIEVGRVEPKPDWSEEDEAAFGDLMWCIEQARKSAKDENDMGNVWFAENWVKNRLDSLRPQPHWKPSEEQMEALHTVCYVPELEVYGGLTYWLKELYEQLKKL